MLVTMGAQYDLGDLLPLLLPQSWEGLHISLSGFLLRVGALCPVTTCFPPQAHPTRASSQRDTDARGHPDGVPP